MSLSKAQQAVRVTLLVFATGILCLGSTSAQAEGSFGFYGGINMAKMGGDIDDLADFMAEIFEEEVGGTWDVDNTNRNGLGFGAYYLVQFSPTFGLSIEGTYVERGTKMDISGRGFEEQEGFVGTSLDGELIFKLNYIEFPVLARFTGSPESTFHPLLMGGPVIGFKTGSEIEVSATGASESTGMLDDFFESTTFGFLAGAGFALDVSETASLAVQGRYYTGLNSAIDILGLVDSKNTGFGVFAGMEFALGQ